MSGGIFVCVVLVMSFLTGCYSTPDGLRKRAGVPWVRDRWVSAYERSPEQVREATIKVLENMGQLTLNDYINNSIEARVDTKFVSVQIIPLESGLTQIITQVRSRSGMPDTNLAREIDKQLALQLPRFRTPVSGTTTTTTTAAPMSYGNSYNYNSYGSSTVVQPPTSRTVSGGTTIRTTSEYPIRRSTGTTSTYTTVPQPVYEYASPR